MSEIKKMRTNGKDIDRIFGLFAALQELTEFSEVMEKRVRTIPNGWRNLRLVIATLDKLTNDIMRTVPPEKLQTIRRMLPRMQFKVVCGVQASTLKQDECIVTINEVETLAKHAHEKCMFCIGDENCGQCQLGKVLDSVLSHDRDGRSWGMIDL